MSLLTFHPQAYIITVYPTLVVRTILFIEGPMALNNQYPAQTATQYLRDQEPVRDVLASLGSRRMSPTQPNEENYMSSLVKPEAEVCEFFVLLHSD